MSSCCFIDSESSVWILSRRFLSAVCRTQSVPAQMWAGRAQSWSRCVTQSRHRCGRDEPGPGGDVGRGERSTGADVAAGESSPEADVGRGEPSPGADVGGVRPVQMWPLQALRCIAPARPRFRRSDSPRTDEAGRAPAGTSRLRPHSAYTHTHTTHPPTHPHTHTSGRHHGSQQPPTANSKWDTGRLRSVGRVL